MRFRRLGRVRTRGAGRARGRAEDAERVSARRRRWWWGERAELGRSEDPAPRPSEWEEAGAVEVGGAGGLRSAGDARAASCSRRPAVVRLLPCRPGGLDMAEVERADGLHRPDAAILPEQPARGIDVHRAAHVI